MRSLLADSLNRLEEAMVGTGHPLADHAVIPVGRPAEETQAVAEDLLGHGLPAELVELWEWCAESRTVLDTVDGLSYSSKLLPGGLWLLSLETSMQWRRARPPELTTAHSKRWLPVLSQEHDVFSWAEIDNADSDGRTPITVNDRENPPDIDPRWRFESIAEMIDAMAAILNTHYWVQDSKGGWHYPVASPEFGWVA